MAMRESAAFQGRRYARIAAALATLAGMGAAVWTLASSEVADFLGEGPARLLPFEGDARRATMGIGVGVATLLTGWGAHALRSRPLAGWAAVVAGVAVGLFLLHALFFAAAALFALAIALDRLDGVPTARFQPWAPGRKPAVWAGGLVAVAVLGIVGGRVTWYLTEPLFDEGEEVREELGFALPGDSPASSSGDKAMMTTGAAASGATSVSGPAVLAQGELMGEDSFHFGEGQVRLIRSPDGKHIVRFENFKVRNGPDLFVYVSPDPKGSVDASGAVNISELRATSGDVNYELPANVDPGSIKSVVIYCRQFKVKFATAPLM